MSKLMWWEEQSAMAEDYKDLEWLAYNFPGLGQMDAEDFDDITGPLSEQLWAVREGLA